jgi:2-methylcitrate dehydratase PrpD
MVGAVGGIGAAVAAASLLGLDDDRTLCALGTAGGQAGGLRATYSTYAGHLLAGEAARIGLLAALLADAGFVGPERVIEDEKGFAAVFATSADPDVAIRDLGQDFEIRRTSYKPYPAGFVLDPVIDVCLDLAREHDIAPETIERIALQTSPTALKFAGNKTPASALAAGTSLYYWAAVSFLFRAAGLQQRTDALTSDPAVIALRDRVEITADPALSTEAARIEVTLRDGRVLKGEVQHARGTPQRPLTDAELDEKFLAQATTVLPADTARALLDLCWRVETVEDIGAALAGVLG